MKIFSFWIPSSCSDASLRLQVLVLAVHRNRIFRMHQRINQLDLFLACMSGNMDILENNLCTLHRQLVDDSRYSFFIPGNRIRGLKIIVSFGPMETFL